MGVCTLVPDSKISSLKQALIQMARQPACLWCNDAIVEKLIDEIYVEIRACRIAGCTWEELSTMINEKCTIRVNQEIVSSIFRKLDLKYAKETGVKALPITKRRGGGKKPTTVKKVPMYGDLGDGPICTYTGKKRGRPKSSTGGVSPTKQLNS